MIISLKSVKCLENGWGGAAVISSDHDFHFNNADLKVLLGKCKCS